MALRIPACLSSYELVYGAPSISPVFLAGAGFLSLIALLTFLGSSAAMTVYERVMLSSFSLLLLILWPLSLVLNYPNTLFTLTLLFSGIMLVFMLLKLQNRWVRDGVYLLLLLLYAWPWYQVLA